MLPFLLRTLHWSKSHSLPLQCFFLWKRAKAAMRIRAGVCGNGINNLTWSIISRNKATKFRKLTVISLCFFIFLFCHHLLPLHSRISFSELYVELWCCLWMWLFVAVSGRRSECAYTLTLFCTIPDHEIIWQYFIPRFFFYFPNYPRPYFFSKTDWQHGIYLMCSGLLKVSNMNTFISMRSTAARSHPALPQ